MFEFIILVWFPNTITIFIKCFIHGTPEKINSLNNINVDKMYLSDCKDVQGRLAPGWSHFRSSRITHL